ncbi:MAG TPA: 3'(2'),5'-bisphosphate nucleotidase CysQ [Cellvibrionaceae bacterium]|nr:3'(2'),5'-bisphosphate nucleotidase CysQ [Cellvibrionaceae bacterium]
MPLRNLDFNALSSALWPLAQAAGTAILDVIDHNTALKADDSPVTAADLAAHNLLLQALPQVIALPVVSEETPAGQALLPDTCWLVDPLDGTKEFIAGNDEFVVCIALMKQCQPLYGYIYQPRTGTAFWGGAQWGSFKRAQGGPIAPMQSRRAPFDEPLIALVSRQGAKAEAPWLEQLSRHWPSGVMQQPMGSALKACVIADGRADIYPRRGRTCIWDTAAAQAILQGAGGDFFGLDGKPLRYNPGSLYNPEFIAVADKNLPWLDVLGIA